MSSKLSFIYADKYSADLKFSEKKINCRVGLNGIGWKNREGDRVTPKGVYSLGSLFYREDRIGRIKTSLKKIKIRKNLGWSTDSRDKNYNKLIRTPHRFIHEPLYREDCVYDLLITLNYNSLNIKKYKGSAIFLHCLGKNIYTEGCIAMEKKYLLQLLKTIVPSTRVIIRK